MSYCDAHKRLCHIMTSINGYVALRQTTCVTMVLPLIVMVDHVDFGFIIDGHCFFHSNIMGDHNIVLQRLVNFNIMSHCDIHQGLCRIIAFIKGYVAL